MNAHTPGPWFISYTHDGNTEIAIDDTPGMDGERDYDLITVTHGDPDELLANARLVAAAPDLLAALLQIAALAEYNTTGPGKCKSEKLTAEQASSLRKSISDIARAAIAKTTE